MDESRRVFLSTAMAAVVASAFRITSAQPPGDAMYGLIGKITAVAGQRAALARILIEGISGMPGCLSYVVAADSSEPDALWVTEVWESQASHDASLQLPSVQAAIAKGRPLIAGFANRIVTTPIGGHGLTAVEKG